MLMTTATRIQKTAYSKNSIIVKEILSDHVIKNIAHTGKVDHECNGADGHTITYGVACQEQSNHRPGHSNGTAQNTLAKQSFIMVNGSTRGTMLKYSMLVYGVK